MSKFVLIACLLFYFGTSIIAVENIDYTLKSISVVFRHGDRTPEPYPRGVYQTDPYKNDTFDPVGRGGLTHDGKRRAYQLGKLLRERYDKFLGNEYRSSEVKAISSYFNRAKMSLITVLAGMYPPKNKQKWHEDLDWQPIPIDETPREKLNFMNSFISQLYVSELERVRNTEEYKRELSKFEGLMKNLTNLIGQEVKDTDIICNLFRTLTAQKSMNLTLPKWTENYLPNGILADAAIFDYKTRSYNQLLTKLTGGLFVRKILDDTVFNENEIISPKVHLYSMHDIHVVAILQVFDIWNHVLPEYCSAVIFELYEKGSDHYFKVVYYKGIPAEFEDRTIPECTEYCPEDDFLNLIKDYLPDKDLIADLKSSGFSRSIANSVDSISVIYQIFFIILGKTLQQMIF